MTQSIDYPWMRAVLQAEPDFYRNRKREPEYEFTKRTFYADNSTRGFYGSVWEFSSDFADDFDTLIASARTENGH